MCDSTGCLWIALGEKGRPGPPPPIMDSLRDPHLRRHWPRETKVRRQAGQRSLVIMLFQCVKQWDPHSSLPSVHVHTPMFEVSGSRGAGLVCIVPQHGDPQAHHVRLQPRWRTASSGSYQGYRRPMWRTASFCSGWVVWRCDCNAPGPATGGKGGGAQGLALRFGIPTEQESKARTRPNHVLSDAGMVSPYDPGDTPRHRQVQAHARHVQGVWIWKWKFEV